MKLVQESELAEALKRQHRTGEEKRLGNILVEMGVISETDLQQALQYQVLNVLREMFSWERGFFMFRSLKIKDHGEVEVDARDLVVDQPIDTRRVALDAARQYDETIRDRPKDGEQKPSAVLDAAEEPDDVSPEQTALGDLLSDVAGPTVTAETVREVFEHAAKVFDRGVIFTVHSHGIRGIAQFGLAEGDEPPSQRVRRLWLPADEPSVISWAINLRSAFRGRAERNRWNEVLFDVLVGGWPDESVAIPIIKDGRATMVFYGDNEPHDLPVGSTTQLEDKLKEIGGTLEPET
jgi:hypothetical protein